VTALLEPFAFSFFRYGLVVAVLAGALCGLVGTYVVLRGMSYIGHGLAHAVFGGAVVGVALGIDVLVAAGLWGIVAGLAIHRVARRRGIGADAAIGVVTTASFAAGIAIISRARSFTANVEGILFGNVLGVTARDLLVVAGVLVAAVLFVVVWYRPLLFVTFDSEVAEISGVNVARVDALLAVVLAASIVASLRILGATLIAAALVIPPVVARMLTSSFGRMLPLSTGLGALTGLAGMYLSFYLDISSGATIVLVAAALFLVVYAATAYRRAAA
jgi:ABC-type Mn2+/Zn2+ transport system permease subunit